MNLLFEIKKIIGFLISLFYFVNSIKAQNVQKTFQQAFNDLNVKLSYQSPCFAQASLLVETAYSGGSSRESEYKTLFSGMASNILKWVQINESVTVNKKSPKELNSAIFHYFSDTIFLLLNRDKYFHPPFIYNHTDPAGKTDWTNTFVTKLLATHKGNCKSLSYLYKILADELGAKCWLALAPGHIYIKNYSQKVGWYNTELTSGTFPNNGWIMASGYITMDAIKSGMYMDTLSNRQAVANLAVDLALGYQRKTGIQADSFILKCCDLTLQYHAVNPNALLLKAETMKRMYLDMQDTKSVIARQWFAQMEEVYVRLYKLGYRQMPERMYKQWLQSINDNRKKYTNPRVVKAVNKK